MATGPRSTESGRWARDRGALWREAPCALTVVLGPYADAPISLRGTGAELWAALARPGTASELAARLADDAHTDVEIVRRDIEPVLDGLAAAGAVRPDP